MSEEKVTPTEDTQEIYDTSTEHKAAELIFSSHNLYIPKHIGPLKQTIIDVDWENETVQIRMLDHIVRICIWIVNEVKPDTNEVLEN